MNRKPSAPLAAPVRALLRNFRAQRPLRGGSLLITVFGDSIAPRGAAATLGSLIRLAGPFGLTERLVRTAVARLARDGWLAARRSGRRSEYRLTPTGAERFAQATRRIYGESPSVWDGKWTLVVVPAGRPRRAQVREVFRISKVGNVAGCMVIDGLIKRDSEVRVLRDNVVVFTGKMESLRRFKNDASEVKTGFECGLTVRNFADIKPNDIIEAFATERVAAEVMA